MITSPFLQRPGAVEATGVDAGVAAHYGEWAREQRSILDGAGVVDMSNRGVVTVSGPDRLSWLHSITTQQLSDLPPFRSTESLVLSPHGHIEHDLHLVDDGERTWLTVEPGAAPALLHWLRKMQFMLRVEVRDVTADFAVVGQASCQETGSEDLAAGRMVWVDPWPTVGPASASYAADELHPATGRQWAEVIVPRTQLETYVGVRPLAGQAAAEALRVEAWRPRVGFETDHRTIPHELDWLRTAVHLHKGCYRGQETVARVHNLGRPPRRLVFLHLDGSGHVLPEPGAELTTPGASRPVGRVTSVARHHVDGPIALAVVKRNLPIDALLTCAGIAAAQTVIVVP